MEPPHMRRSKRAAIADGALRGVFGLLVLIAFIAITILLIWYPNDTESPTSDDISAAGQEDYGFDDDPPPGQTLQQ